MQYDYRKLNSLICKSGCTDIDVVNTNMKVLGKGGQGIVYLYESNKCGQSAVKVSKNIPESINEIFFLKETKKLVDRKVCPHFVYNYCSRKEGNRMYIYNEYADGTLEEWFKSHHTENEWKSMLFQLLYAIYVFQKKLGGVHNDLKPKNILFKKIIGGIFEYVISGKKYYVPTHGYLFMMADYGKSESLLQDKHNREKVESLIKTDSDYEYIYTLPKRILVSAAQNKFKNMDVFLKTIREKIDDKFTTYMESEKNKINNDLSKYPQKIRDNMLLRSMIYYAIEREIIKIGNIESEYFVMKYPPDGMDKFIEFKLSLDAVGQSYGHTSDSIIDTFIIE